MNRRSVMRIFSIIISTCTILIVVGNGCSQEFTALDSNGPMASLDASGVGSAGNSSNDVPVIPDTKTVSLVYSNQVLNQLTTCAGVVKPSDQTVQMYELKKGAISVYGSATTVTPPMMMAITSIAGEVCNDLINQEINNGERIFVGFNLNSNVLPSNSAVVDAITRLSLSCWQKNENSTERIMLTDAVFSTIASNETGASKKAALMLCTSMLSSLDALLN